MNTASLMTTSNALPCAPRSGRCPTGPTAPLFGSEPALGISFMPWIEHPCVDMNRMIAALQDGVALLRSFHEDETPRHPCEFPLNAQGTLTGGNVCYTSAEFQLEICLDAEQWLQLFVYPGNPTLYFWWDDARNPSDAPDTAALRDMQLFPDLRTALTALGEQAGMSGMEFVENLRRTGRLDAAGDALVTAALACAYFPYGLMTPDTDDLATFAC